MFAPQDHLIRTICRDLHGYEHSTDGPTLSKVIRGLCHFPTVCWRQVLEQICLCPAVKIGMEKRESMIHEQRGRVIACTADLFVVKVISLVSLKLQALSVNRTWTEFLFGTVP